MGEARGEAAWEGAAKYNATTGWVASTSAPGGQGVTYTTRDGDGRPTLMTLSGSRTLGMSYDVSGNVVSITPPSRPAHGFTYEGNDRVSTYAPPDVMPTLVPKDTTYVRDLDGLTLLANHPGKAVSYAYDGAGQMTKRVGAVTTTYARDGQGRVTTVTTSDGVTQTNSYDGALVTQQAISGPFAHALNKTYDNYLRITSWNMDGANAVSVTYDGDDLITATGGMTVTRSVNGLLTGTTLGAVGDGYTYNGYGEVVGHTVSGAATSYSVTYDRDSAGRIHMKMESVGGVTHTNRYEYDAAGRLWEVYVDGVMTPTRTWTYDGNGNRSGGTYDAQDRLTASGVAMYTYGNNGEVTKKTVTSTSAETQYEYDAQGNLRTVTRPAPETAIQYIIDGQNRRVGKKVGGALAQGWLYDGSRIIGEVDGSGAVVSRFVYATGGHSPDVMVKSGTTYRVVKDHLGSPRLVVDSATGAIAQELEYDEWGNVTSDTNPGFQPFGFAGGQWDRDTKLVRFGARDYDPTTGRWTTKDASRFGGGLNFYGYVKNDPVDATDPSGLFPIVPVGPSMCKVQCGLSLFAELDRCPPIELPPSGDEYSCPPRPGDDPWGFKPPCESVANSHYDMCIDSCEGKDPIRPIPNDDHTHGRPEHAGN